MSDLAKSLESISERVGGVSAAMIVEVSGIEVATWGDADFELVGAEMSELWKLAGDSEVVASGGPMKHMLIVGRDTSILALPLGSEYALVVVFPARVPAGKVKFYGSEWVLAHQEDFL